MEASSMTKLSSKGQVVIPEEIRESLGTKPGAQFVVMGSGDTVVLKTIVPPSPDDFKEMVRKVHKGAIVLTAGIIDEYMRVVAELARRYPRVDAEAFLGEIIRRGEVRSSVTLLHSICVDPSDDNYLQG